MGMRAAARDKKKKRKLKRKNNKLLYEKHFGIAEKSLLLVIQGQNYVKVLMNLVILYRMGQL